MGLSMVCSWKMRILFINLNCSELDNDGHAKDKRTGPSFDWAYLRCPC